MPGSANLIYHHLFEFRTLNIWPVMLPESFEAKNTAVSETSSGKRMFELLSIRLELFNISVLISPGQIAFTRCLDLEAHQLKSKKEQQ